MRPEEEKIAAKYECDAENMETNELYKIACKRIILWILN